jgi:hypothetical protein
VLPKVERSRRLWASQLNAALDLDKHDAQTVSEQPELTEKTLPASFTALLHADTSGGRADGITLSLNR